MMRKFEFVLNCDFRAVSISNVRWVRGASGGANAGDGADRDGRWRQKREQYRYAQDEYRGPQMGGFGGRHCK